MTALCVAITGADGFIGSNLSLRLRELGHRAIGLSSASSDADWAEAVLQADAIVHLAAANRPEDPASFELVNGGTARQLVEVMQAAARPVPVVYASSIRAAADDDYGRSKLSGEQALVAYGERSGAAIHIFRLPNVCGKWARPNYNSAVATFCYNVARGRPIIVHDPAASLQLVYIDDVVKAFIDVIEGQAPSGFHEVAPVYDTTVGEVADIIRGFRSNRAESFIDEVGAGLTRALYATYVAALPPEEFSYPVVSHRDARGAFSEVLKTHKSGQFSYFTALPGVTRGGHYHHTKTEKFLIVHGQARFGFRHMLTGETHEIFTSGDEPTIVETVPGWTHDVTNIGEEVLISLLWANEVFDRARPDTIAEVV